MKKYILFAIIPFCTLIAQSCKKDTPLTSGPPKSLDGCNGGGQLNITTNTTIEDVYTDPAAIDYVVECRLYVYGGINLTIKPGVRIQFTNANSGIVVVNNAGLIMNGTASAPIVLEGASHVKGLWSGVELRSQSANTIFNYVTISDGGSGTSTSLSEEAGLFVGTASTGSNNVKTITNCTFNNNKGVGFFAQYNTVIETFANNNFTNNENVPIKIDAFNLNMLHDDNTFSGNGKNYISIYKGHATNGYMQSITIRKNRLNYSLATGEKLMMRSGTLTIEPGVTLEMASDAEITIYDGGTFDPQIIAVGTASEPINIKGAIDAVGYWKGISIGTNTLNELRYCNISNAGSSPVSTLDPDFNTAILVTKAHIGKATITNCNISKSGGYGITYGTSGSVVSQSSNTFSANSLSDINTF